MHKLAIALPFVTLTLLFSCRGGDTHAAYEGEWTSLFNGKDLTGWVVKSLPEDRAKTFWTVEDGAIVCNSMGRREQDYVWLMTEKEFGDFELRLSFQAYRDSPGNSGVQIRSRYDEGPEAPRGGWLDGPQIDVHPPAPWRIGLIYDETREERRWISPSLEDWNIDDSYAPDEWRFVFADEEDGWNQLRIIARGTRIETFLNGLQMTDYDGAGVLDNEAHRTRRVGLSGHIALQLHADDELRMRFKDLRIREL